MKKISVFILLLPLHIYRLCISPLTPPTCRFIPTCSQYAQTALTRHGALRGGWLTICRLGKCHPFCKHHGYDPVPEKLAQSSEKCKTKSNPKNEQ